jgi:hypothetical protein
LFEVTFRIVDDSGAIRLALEVPLSALRFFP